MEKNGDTGDKEPPADAGAAGNVGLSLGGQDPLEKGRTTAPALLPGESHGQRSLAGYGPQGYKKSDMAEATEHSHMAQGSVFNTLW